MAGSTIACTTTFSSTPPPTPYCSAASIALAAHIEVSALWSRACSRARAQSSCWLVLAVLASGCHTGLWKNICSEKRKRPIARRRVGKRSRTKNGGSHKGMLFYVQRGCVQEQQWRLCWHGKKKAPASGNSAATRNKASNIVLVVPFSVPFCYSNHRGHLLVLFIVKLCKKSSIWEKSELSPYLLSVFLPLSPVLMSLGRRLLESTSEEAEFRSAAFLEICHGFTVS